MATSVLALDIEGGYPDIISIGAGIVDEAGTKVLEEVRFPIPFCRERITNWSYWNEHLDQLALFEKEAGLWSADNERKAYERFSAWFQDALLKSCRTLRVTDHPAFDVGRLEQKLAEFGLPSLHCSKEGTYLGPFIDTDSFFRGATCVQMDASWINTKEILKEFHVKLPKGIQATHMPEKDAVFIAMSFARVRAHLLKDFHLSPAFTK